MKTKKFFKSPIKRLKSIYKPMPDEQGVDGTQAALDLTRDLRSEDTVLFLLSGGGSALFEKPLIPLEELQWHYQDGL